MTNSTSSSLLVTMTTNLGQIFDDVKFDADDVE